MVECPSCRTVFHRQPRFCENCGHRFAGPPPLLGAAPPPLPKSGGRGRKWILGGFAALLLLLVLLVESAITRQKQADGQKARAAFAAMTPSEHLERAKSALTGKPSDDAIADALRDLEAIPPDASAAAEGKIVQGNLIAERQKLRLESDQASSSRPSDLSPQVKYTVTASSPGSASLTYRNASGGTEQRTVTLPWELTFSSKRGAFVYLSAQKRFEDGNIGAIIYVNGLPIQQAEADSASNRERTRAVKSLASTVKTVAP